MRRTVAGSQHHKYTGILMSFDVQFLIPFKRIDTPKVMMTLLILIVKFH